MVSLRILLCSLKFIFNISLCEICGGTVAFQLGNNKRKADVRRKFKKALLSGESQKIQNSWTYHFLEEV